MSTPSTVITVTQLTAAIKNQLESRFINLTVQGEMSNCKLHSSGHLYFDLKDAGAKIPAVLFRAKESKLSRLPKEGDHVVVTGALSVYPPHGKYQIIAKSIEYQGVGELLMRLEALKKKLGERGWLDADKKKPLPKFPRRIGVVTSPTGAVIRDIIHILSRRYAGFQLILNPVRVQGSEAAYEIAEAIEQMNRHHLCDVMIVGRGGGSLEDLWPFNEEVVARAIFESGIPIVSAVGHETDVTIADFVADVRAPTPSAAAEIVSAEKQHHLQFLEKMRSHLTSALLHRIKHCRATLDGYLRHPLFSSSYALLGGPLQRLDEIKTRLDSLMKQELLRKRYLLEGRKKESRALNPSNQLLLCQNRLSGQIKQLDQSIQNKLAANKQRLKEVIQQLTALDPKNVLKRGYSILFALNEGSVIVSARELRPGKRLEALFSDGKATLRVDDE
ncbi:MAG: exodeoxyribonuclease VII large subunit [Chlamydiales bacterium]|nr:exodeoxyribonuclease VII large subunit [Chlamydiales bacterium]